MTRAIAVASVTVSLPPFFIRPAVSGDAADVCTVHERAFPTAAEARLVAALRESRKDWVSLVAECEGAVVGHVLFSPVTIDAVAADGVGMAPVAVSPAHQGRGAGKRLIEQGLAVCRKRTYPFVVVMGAPDYYRRFGFARASDRRLSNVYGVDDEFMVLELTAGSLPTAGGLVRYAAEFDELEGE